MNYSLTMMEWARLLLLYTHLIASMLAIASVLSADIGLVIGNLQREQLRNTIRNIARLLAVLWSTGLTIVWLDTGFDPAELMSRSKLLVKLVAVSVLTLNGLVLHRLCFPVLLSVDPLSLRATVLLAVTGSLSTMHWLLAAFIGVAKPLARISFEKLLEGYAMLVVSTVVLSIVCMPLVRHRVHSWRRSTSSVLQLDVPL